MPVVEYENGSKKILVNSQFASWSESATETDGELYVDSIPVFETCNALADYVNSGDFDSGYADEPIDMNGASTYPLMVPDYTMMGCSLNDNPNALIRMAFEGGYIEGTMNVNSQDVTFNYADLKH